MKTFLPLCVLVLSAVGFTMVELAKCVRELALEAPAALTKGKDAACTLLHNFKKCVKKTCPQELEKLLEKHASHLECVSSTPKRNGVTQETFFLPGSHASHLVYAQTMPVLLLFIISLFFGVF